MSAYQLRTELNFPVGTRRIQQILKGMPRLKYRKMHKALQLSTCNILKRFKWTRRFISRGVHYSINIIFSDEKSAISMGQMDYCITGMIYGRNKGNFLLCKEEVDLLCFGLQYILRCSFSTYFGWETGL